LKQNAVLFLNNMVKYTIKLGNHNGIQ